MRRGWRLTLLCGPCAVTSVHPWQQNVLGMALCLRVTVAHAFPPFGLPEFLSRVVPLCRAYRVLRFSVWMLKGAWRFTQGVTEVLDSACVRVLCTALPCSRNGDPLVFRPLIRDPGVGNVANHRGFTRADFLGNGHVEMLRRQRFPPPLARQSMATGLRSRSCDGSGNSTCVTQVLVPRPATVTNCLVTGLYRRWVFLG